jgi:hypothetical protein
MTLRAFSRNFSAGPRLRRSAVKALSEFPCQGVTGTSELSRKEMMYKRFFSIWLASMRLFPVSSLLGRENSGHIGIALRRYGHNAKLGPLC